MKFVEMELENGKTMLLLPGTACTWQINFAMVIDELKERYHLICVNYDGFDGDGSKPFTDMITVTEKIEDYLLRYHGGQVDGAYGSSLGGSFVGLLVQRKRIHIDHAILGGSDLDQGGKVADPDGLFGDLLPEEFSQDGAGHGYAKHQQGRQAESVHAPGRGGEQRDAYILHQPLGRQRVMHVRRGGDSQAHFFAPPFSAAAAALALASAVM